MAFLYPFVLPNISPPKPIIRNITSTDISNTTNNEGVIATAAAAAASSSPQLITSVANLHYPTTTTTTTTTTTKQFARGVMIMESSNAKKIELIPTSYCPPIPSNISSLLKISDDSGNTFTTLWIAYCIIVNEKIYHQPLGIFTTSRLARKACLRHLVEYDNNSFLFREFYDDYESPHPSIKLEGEVFPWNAVKKLIYMDNWEPSHRTFLDIVNAVKYRDPAGYNHVSFCIEPMSPMNSLPKNLTSRFPVGLMPLP